MLTFEIACWLIMALFVLASWRYAAQPRRFVARMGLLIVAAWIGEQSCISLYGFYRYDPRWSLFVGDVPLLVIVIWPAVILSALELASALAPRWRWCGVLAGVFVFFDASLIEPVAVQASLWRWFEPGFLGVPPIGILGWAFFAGAACTLFLHNQRRSRGPSWDVLVLLLAPVATHLFLLAGWWGALRWVNVFLNPWAVVGGFYLVLLPLTIVIWHRRLASRIPLTVMLTRVPPSLLFLTLLVRHGSGEVPLIFHFLAFVPPYLALVNWRPAEPAREFI